MPTWEDVRRLCLVLPDVLERNESFRTNGRIFANMSREPGAISTRAPEEDIQLLIRARPDVYFLTPHYVGWDAVLVRLETVDEDESRAGSRTPTSSSRPSGRASGTLDRTARVETREPGSR